MSIVIETKKMLCPLAMSRHSEGILVPTTALPQLWPPVRAELSQVPEGYSSQSLLRCPINRAETFAAMQSPGETTGNASLEVCELRS